MSYHYLWEDSRTFRGPLDWPNDHPFYGCHVHPPGTENWGEDELIDGIDLRRWLERDGRRFTADYDRAIDPFATTLDIEPVDEGEVL